MTRSLLCVSVIALVAGAHPVAAQIAKPGDFPPPATQPGRTPEAPKKKEPFKPAPLPPQPDAELVILTPASEVRFTTDSPDLGARSSESALLREDPRTGACELLVRLPPGFRLRPHWHTANQTHTVLRGAYSMSERNTPLVEMGAGAFNFTPGLLVHEGRVTGGEAALLYVTFDRKRDQKLVEDEGQPPRPLGEGQPEMREKFLIVQPGQVRWKPLAEGLAAEVAVLHENKGSGAGSVMLRTAGPICLPKHWHTAGVAAVVLSGSLDVPRGGGRVTLDTGSYAYLPPKLAHEAWTGPRGVTLLLTTDGAWDVNWVEDPAGAAPAPPPAEPKERKE
ncbi:MAG: DUF4437 domain-containing protein [Phycisphaerales bacterium]